MDPISEFLGVTFESCVHFSLEEIDVSSCVICYIQQLSQASW